MKLDPYLTPYTKIKLKWMKGINVRTKEENTGVTFHNSELGNGILDIIPSTSKEKNR